MKSKPRGGRTTFVTSDIIPLINKAWETTLGNKRFAQKAIAERGWGPLTYVLLDHHNFKESECLFHPIDKNANIIDLSTINQTGAAFEKRLDLLVEARSKSLARKLKYDKILSDDATKLSNVEKYERLTSISSGKLCGEGLFSLSEIAIRDRLQAIENEKVKLHNEMIIRKITSESKQQIKFRVAVKKFFTKDTPLRCADMRVLLKEIWKKGDGRTKTKLEELTNQLESRKERLDKYNIFDVVEGEVAKVNNNESISGAFGATIAFENSISDIPIATNSTSLNCLSIQIPSKKLSFRQSYVTFLKIGFITNPYYFKLI